MRPMIVAAVDFSEITPSVLEQAAREIKLRPGAQLHLIHVVPMPPTALAGALSPELTVDVTGALELARTELKTVASAAGIDKLDVVGHVRAGDAVNEVIGLADETDAEMIILGASAKGIAMRALLGSVSRGVMSRAPCSVLLVRPKNIPAIDPRRADQDDDVHKRHHPQAHTFGDGRASSISMITFHFTE